MNSQLAFCSILIHQILHVFGVYLYQLILESEDLALSVFRISAPPPPPQSFRDVSLAIWVECYELVHAEHVQSQ